MTVRWDLRKCIMYNLCDTVRQMWNSHRTHRCNAAFTIFWELQMVRFRISISTFAELGKWSPSPSHYAYKNVKVNTTNLSYKSLYLHVIQIQVHKNIRDFLYAYYKFGCNHHCLLHHRDVLKNESLEIEIVSWSTDITLYMEVRLQENNLI